MAPPTPTAFVLLIALLPLVWFSGAALAARLSRDTALAALLAPALAVALWLTAIHVASLAASSFWIGLPVGTFATAGLGLLSRFYPVPGFPAAAASSPRDFRWMWLSALLATAYIAPAALRWWFHDELLVTGHLSMIAEIQNGIYPPRHLSFPEFELRYHYGFDLLTAAVASMLRMRADRAIDLVTLLAWAYSWCLAWTLGNRLVGIGWGGLTAAAVLFGGGLPLFSTSHSLLWRLSGIGAVGGNNINLPLVSYFFQHPWTLGLPLAFAAILVILARDSAAPQARAAALAVLLVALSFTQTILFLCLTGALLVAEPAAQAKLGWKKAAAAVLLLGAVLFAATCLHGFFAPAPPGTENAIELKSAPVGGSDGWAGWHFASFGLILPLGIVGLFFLARERLLFALLVGGSLVIFESLRYRWSWDIVKFATVAALVLSFGASAALRRLFELRPNILGRAAVALAAVGLVAAGLVFPLATGFYGADGPLSEKPAALSPDDQQAVQWLRKNIRPGEIVGEIVSGGFDPALGYAQWGGLPVLEWYGAEWFPLPRRALEKRERFVEAAISDPDAFLRERVRWLVLKGDDEVVKRWIATGRAAVRARFGALEVIEIIGEIPAS